MAFSIVLYDAFVSRNHLLPLASTRPVSNLRVGILTINRKWELIFDTDVSYWTIDYLSAKFSLKTQGANEFLLLKGGVLPDADLVQCLQGLHLNQVLVDSMDNWVAIKLDDLVNFSLEHIDAYEKIIYNRTLCEVKYPEDIFVYNSMQISYDLKIMKLQNTTKLLPSGVSCVGDNIFIHPNVSISSVLLDSSKGPIYIGEGTLVEAGVVVYGPAAIGDHCRIKAGTIIYPNVTAGDNTTLGGELNNVVFWGNSAKGHVGYLGCAVIGEGCNLGAGTTNSNLKNDWSTVKLYDYISSQYRNTNLIKCGAVIGDQVMLGIQSMLTTGTVIGTGAQVAMSKFIPKFVPDFSWLTDEKYESYNWLRFKDMMKRKSQVKKEIVTDDELTILEYIHQYTEELRRNNNQH